MSAPRFTVNARDWSIGSVANRRREIDRMPIDKTAEPWRVSWLAGLMTAAMIGFVVFLGGVL